MVEGFPGNRPYHYTYEVLNHTGMVDALHDNGYDLVIVGLDDGMQPIEQNVGVLTDCIKQARARTARPLVVGGLSMGGLISRYALAQIERTGQTHGTRVYLSIDAPHRGTYTSLGVQWFVHSLVPFMRALQGFASLLDAPSNQQLLLHWLHDGKAGPSPLRESFQTRLTELGYPRQPRKLAVSCGQRDGEGAAEAGARTLGWSDAHVAVTLNTLPGDTDGVIAEGSWLGAPLAPLHAPTGERPWETVRGGQNTYNREVGEFVASLGYDDVQRGQDCTCGIPTVSALDLDQDPLDAVPLRAGPFDAYTCSATNVQHVQLTDELSTWVVQTLGVPPAPTPREYARGLGPWNPYVFDPYDPAFLADPYATYARFREHDPDFFVPRFASRWFFRYDACDQILKDQTGFLKNDPDGSDATPGPIGILRAFGSTVFTSDPPRHQQLRDAFGPQFAHHIEQAEANATARAEKILEKVSVRGYMELVGDYGLPVPANIVFDVLGIPDDQTVREGLLQWAGLIIAATDKRLPASMLGQAATAKMALQTYLDGLLRQYRQGAPEGLIGSLAQAPGSLQPEDVYTTCVEFVIAGYMSTTWLVASAIQILIDQKQVRALRADRSKVKVAIDEILRLEPPVQLIDRYAANDMELCGVALRRGEKVTAVIASANRDCGFTDPDTFKLDRANSGAHLSFGDGIHRCIGEPLAKCVAPVMLDKLLDLGEPVIDGLPQWQTNPYLRGTTNLPLRF
jgi:cytochrome P450